MSIRRSLAVVSAAAMITLLAACGATTEPIPSPTAAPTSTPTPTPTSTADPLTRPALSELVLTTRGLGTLELGTDPTTLNPETSIVEELPDSACEGGTAQRWAAAYPERPLGNELRAFEVGRLLPGDRIQAIQVFDPLIRTSVGLAPGMTIDQMSTMYPEAEFVMSGGGRDQYLLEQDAAGVLVADVWQDGTEMPGLISSMSIGLVGPPSFHSLGSC